MLIAFVVLVESPCVVGPEIVSDMYICLAAHPCCRFVSGGISMCGWIRFGFRYVDTDGS